MINIEYTLEALEGEPGPNLYWHGLPVDFLQAIMELRPLGVKNGVEIHINQLTGTTVYGDISVLARSSVQGHDLVSVKGNSILIDLDCRIWREVFCKFLTVCFHPSFNYVEFDDLALTENANFIISSEG